VSYELDPSRTEISLHSHSAHAGCRGGVRRDALCKGQARRCCTVKGRRTSMRGLQQSSGLAGASGGAERRPARQLARGYGCLCAGVSCGARSPRQHVVDGRLPACFRRPQVCRTAGAVHDTRRVGSNKSGRGSAAIALAALTLRGGRMKALLQLRFRMPASASVCARMFTVRLAQKVNVRVYPMQAQRADTKVFSALFAMICGPIARCM